MDWLREAAAGLALLTAAANLGYYFGSRRRVETKLDEIKAELAMIWEEIGECRRDRRSLAVALAEKGHS